MQKIHPYVWLALAVALVAGPVLADERGDRRVAVGAQLDLFPTVVSAAAGKFGIAPQVWLGAGHLRARFVVASMHLPDALAFQDGFVRPQILALATVLDYTFGEDFDGFWVGPGLELWRRSIRYRGEHERARFTSLVATLGAGYIFLLPRHVYVDPWLGLHVVCVSSEARVEGHRYAPFPVALNASVKIGWFGRIGARP